MIQRKAVLGKTAEMLHKRVAEGRPLPPTMIRGSKEYIKSSYWQTLNQRCANGRWRVNSKRNESYLRKNVLLLITKEDFDRWVDDNWEKFDALYKAGKTPSIDRISNSGNYEIENMDVVDLKENMAKDRRKKVIGVHVISGEEIEFDSAKTASKHGFDQNLISRSARSEYSHKQYKWRFA